MTAKLRRADIGHLVSVWFPYATEETLIEVTYFVGWMYLIDDELDGLSNPEGQPGFKSLIDNTIAFFENEENVDNGAFDRIKKEGYEGVESFEKTGIALRKRYTREQRKLFYEEATKTLEMYQVENDIRIAGRLPTLDEYWNYREGSSCIGMVVAMIE